METLTLNDGTVLENSHAIENNDRLFIYVENGSTISQVFEIFIDPEKTKKITFTNLDSSQITWRGYKRLMDVRDEEHGLITAMLKKN